MHVIGQHGGRLFVDGRRVLSPTRPVKDWTISGAMSHIAWAKAVPVAAWPEHVAEAAGLLATRYAMGVGFIDQPLYAEWSWWSWLNLGLDHASLCSRARVGPGATRDADQWRRSTKARGLLGDVVLPEPSKTCAVADLFDGKPTVIIINREWVPALAEALGAEVRCK